MRERPYYVRTFEKTDISDIVVQRVLCKPRCFLALFANTVVPYNQFERERNENGLQIGLVSPLFDLFSRKEHYLCVAKERGG